jgi:Ca2+-binding RTX toxin-like protein
MGRSPDGTALEIRLEDGYPAASIYLQRYTVSGDSGSPPPPPPPSNGQTFTANDTPGQTLTGGSGDDTFYAGHNSVVMTGDGGADKFVFQYLPWNAGHITDFAVGTDRIDMSALFQASGYTGSDPVGDGYLQFQSDGSDGTRVLYDTDGPATASPWLFVITDLDHVSPDGLTAASVFDPGGSPPPPPPPSGQTFTADDSPGQVLTGGSGDDIFYAGHNSVVMTGDGGADKFVFQYLPWNAGHITDFTPGTDKLDLHALFAASGYAGTDPIADGYLQFQSDGQGGTQVRFDPDGPGSGSPWQFLITTLDHVDPSNVHSGDWFM